VLVVWLPACRPLRARRPPDRCRHLLSSSGWLLSSSPLSPFFFVSVVVLLFVGFGAFVFMGFGAFIFIGFDSVVAASVPSFSWLHRLCLCGLRGLCVRQVRPHPSIRGGAMVDVGLGHVRVLDS